MSVALDGSLTAVIFNPSGGSPLTIKSGANTVIWTLTLPTNPGSSGQALVTDGSGNLSWGAAGGATIVDDTTTGTDTYPIFAKVTSGSPTNYYVSSTKYTYNPASGVLASPHVESSDGIFLNTQVITANYTLPAGTNGLSAGPMSVPPGITVTVTPGQAWKVA
jgi:hypothetical protein